MAIKKPKGMTAFTFIWCGHGCDYCGLRHIDGRGGAGGILCAQGTQCGDAFADHQAVDGTT